MKTLIKFSVVIFIFLTANVIFSQTTAFTYQGKLTNAATPQSKSYALF